MAIFAWVILILSALGFVAVVLAKLPKVLTKPVGRTRLIAAADSLVEYFWRKLKQFGGWLWHFILEAKDIKPAQKMSTQMDKVKKVFRIRIRESEKDPAWLPEVTAQQQVAAETMTQPLRAVHKTAEDMYLETIKKDPNSREAYEGLGRLYLQEKNYSEAVEIFKFLTDNFPNRDVYWSNLGISLYSVKQFAPAAAAYEQAIKINSKIPTRWINLALCFEAVDEHTRAIKAIAKAIELDPRNINYLMLQADIYGKVGNKVRSEEVLSQILAIEPTNKIARERLMKLRI